MRLLVLLLLLLLVFLPLALLPLALLPLALLPLALLRLVLTPPSSPNNAPAGIRWAQTAGYGVVPNAKMPNVFQSISLDLTDFTSPYGSVHIRDKKSVGARLAAGAIATAYRSSSTYSQGPVATGVKCSTLSRIACTVSFGNTGKSGITLKNQTGFEMCTLDAKDPTSCNSTSGEQHEKQIRIPRAGACV